MAASELQQALTSDRRNKALQMRIAKIDYQTIADRLGYADRAAACKDISRAFRRNRKEEDRTLELYKEQELAGLDRAQAAIWPKVLNGVVSAVDAYNRIVQTRARILGMFAPVQHQVLTIDLVEAEIARLEAELGHNRRILGPGEWDGDLVE